MTTEKYIVTEKAGPRVAGHFVRAGDTLYLTPLQAAYERLLGTIVRAPVKEKTPPKPAIKND